jgi:SAM-dependent methyltransferase
MIDHQLSQLLICPKCHGELTFKEEQIYCPACDTHYPLAGKIPVMFADSSNDGFGHDLYHAQLHGNIFERVFHTNRIATLLRLVTKELALPTDAQMLDIGCNTGPMLIPLRGRGYDIVGIDISVDDVQQAECYLGDLSLPANRLSVADGTSLPFRDASFDTILLVDILEHTDFPERIVAETKRLLRPGGIAIATVPWAYHPYVRYTFLRKLLSSRKTIDEHPDAPFKLQMLESLFEHGFEPLCTRLVFHWVCILGVYRLQPTTNPETRMPQC